MNVRLKKLIISRTLIEKRMSPSIHSLVNLYTDSPRALEVAEGRDLEAGREDRWVLTLGILAQQFYKTQQTK